eukprot:10874148-Alexandrium_andersonii.AAC.1
MEEDADADAEDAARDPPKRSRKAVEPPVTFSVTAASEIQGTGESAGVEAASSGAAPPAPH